MLKKLFKIGMLLSLIAVACTVNAQEKKHYEPVYPQYGFWSNWSLGIAPSWSWQSQFKDYTYNGFGLMLFAQKELNYKWDARFSVFGPLTINWAFKKFVDDKGTNGIDAFGEIGVDVLFDFIAKAKGYNPDQKFSFYGILGGGVSTLYDGGPTHTDVVGYAGVYLRGGLGVNYKFAEKWSVFGEYMQDIVNDAPNPFKFNKWHNSNGHIIAGLMYNFGPTDADLELIAQRALLTQENFDALNSEIDRLRDDLKKAKERETQLVNRINELEDQIAHMQPKNDNDALVDSLRRVIDEYENNKHNFYAMPFSITYAVDQYTVPGSQMSKVNALAKILKDNEDINIEIVGYCDYSGSDEYNQKLSEKRAEYVKKLLVRKGIAEDRLTTSGKGKTMPFGDIKNPINRRTSFYRVNK